MKTLRTLSLALAASAAVLVVSQAWAATACEADNCSIKIQVNNNTGAPMKYSINKGITIGSGQGCDGGSHPVNAHSSSDWVCQNFVPHNGTLDGYTLTFRSSSNAGQPFYITCSFQSNGSGSVSGDYVPSHVKLTGDVNNFICKPAVAVNQ